MTPVVIDLFCGIGGWTKGFLAEGYECIGFDIERHQYGDKCSNRPEYTRHRWHFRVLEIAPFQKFT